MIRMLACTKAPRNKRPAPSATGGALRLLGAALVATHLGLAAWAAAWQPRQTERSPDSITLDNGKVIEGVLLERFHPEHLVMLDGTKPREYPHGEVVEVDCTRDRLALLLSKRKPGQGAVEAWALVELALELRLERTARVLAYDVLTLDPVHQRAHEFLGHERKGDTWRWRLEDRPVREEEFHRRIADWNERLVLESAHYRVETSTGLRMAIDTILDLESFYLIWMERLGRPLQATEDVDRPDLEGMVVYVYRDRDDKNFRDYRTKRRDPLYDPSRQTTTSTGNPNVVMTYLVEGAERPAQLFDLATRQLLYSLMLLGRNKGALPVDAISRFGSWAEIGLGYWCERHLEGPPGHPSWRDRLDLELQVLEYSLLRPRRGALKMVRDEVTNLIGLPTVGFHRSGTEDGVIHQAKARTLVSFLMEVDPTVQKRRRQGQGKAAFFHYMREVYGTPRAHSSDAFDEGLGEIPVETLGDPWRAWVKSQI